jgi:hypothetical protein
VQGIGLGLNAMEHFTTRNAWTAHARPQPHRRLRYATCHALRLSLTLNMVLAALLTHLCGCAAAAGNVAIVDTAAALKQALHRGDPHVHVTAHLDLTRLPVVPNPSGANAVNDTAIFWPRAELQSITVRLQDACIECIICGVPRAIIATSMFAVLVHDHMYTHCAHVICIWMHLKLLQSHLL